MSFFFIVGLVGSTPAPHLSTIAPLASQNLSATTSGLGFYLRSLFQRTVRLRLERFLFNQSYTRSYIYLKSVMGLTLFRFNFWINTERSLLRNSSQRGARAFSISDVFTLVFVRAIGFMFTAVGGLFFFVRLVGAMIQKFRRQWALMQYVHQTLNAIRLSFWFHAHIQYRLSLLGRFGGVMRAAKKSIGHGALKLYAWRGVLDYTQVDVPTKWGIFGFSFWLQFRDIPQLRLTRFIQRYRKVLRSLAIGSDEKLAFIDVPFIADGKLHLPTFEAARRPVTTEKSIFFQETVGLRRRLGLTKSLAAVMSTAARLHRSRFISQSRPFSYLAPRFHLFPRYQQFCDDTGHLHGASSFARTPTVGREAWAYDNLMFRLWKTLPVKKIKKISAITSQAWQKRLRRWTAAAIHQRV